MKLIAYMLQGPHIVSIILEDSGIEFNTFLDIAVVLLRDCSAVEARVAEGVSEVGAQLFEAVAPGGEDE